MEKRLTMILACLFLSLGMAMAQTQVTGVVTSADDGLPVIGASVLVVGTSTGTVTDVNGNFNLTIPDGKTTLKFQYIGMETKTLQAKNDMKVSLKSESKDIDEVVVTGYGVQRKASFTGAASLMGADKLEKKNDANFVKTLEGGVTGVQMNNSSSMPGTWGSVFVRGRTSLNSGTQPLYVIDGVPVNSDADGMNSTSNNMIDPMSSVNPNDIESVTVLKDAAATAIYGSRAGNGVIVIKTKNGSQGKFNINVDVKQGFTSMANNNMDFANAEETMQLYASGYAARYKDGTQAEYYDKLKKTYGWDGTSSYDWMDKISRKGYYQDYNVNVSGQSGNTSYYVSGGYLNTDGLIIGSGFKRYSGRANVNSTFKMFNFGANVSYSYAIKNGFSQSTSGSMSNATVAAISSMQPFYPFYNADGSYANVDLYNPLALQDKNLGDINETKSSTINMSPYLQINFGKGIYFKTTLGVNLYDVREYQYWSGVYNPQGMDYPGMGQQYNSHTSTVTWTNILGWNYTFNKLHNISLMLGQESQQKNYWYEYYTGDNFPFASSGMRDLTTAGHWGDSEYYKKEANLASYFMDAHYSYADKYYLSASYRRDGSSVFGSKNRWGDFWSVGAKWRFTAEDWLGLSNNNILTNGTFRASYGTVGNQDIGYYAARGFYASGYNYHGTSGMIPTTISNDQLTWEVSKKFDIGVDLQFINRLNLSLDYYSEKTTDALFEVPLSMTTGMTQTYKNIGSMRNRGIEVALNANIIHKKDFDWNAYANLTWNQNRVLALSTDKPIENTYNIIESGYAYNEFYLKEYAGVDRETGKPLWYLEEKGDKTTTDYNAAAKRHLGSPDPKVYGGFGTSANWKGFDASITFNYRLGAKVLDRGAQFTGWGMKGRTPLEKVALNSWTETNKDAAYPQYIYGDLYHASSESSRFLMSGNFLRLSNITLGYTLPQNLVKKAFMEKVRVYVSIDNLHTWTASDFTGYTPETYDTGVIAWQYPATATFIGGVQVTF
ncbi:MAG: TonB-dependent receptor [Prevotella sp.]|nr:TonB-dependent receptor [Prevotella sp.]